jgi:hypothetical protein
MDEHTFDQSGAKDSRAAVLDRVIELAECVLEEVSRARQDWRAVVAMARELEALALCLDGSAARHESPADSAGDPLFTDSGALYHMGPENRHLHEDV